jgi:hypothetical protein
MEPYPLWQLRARLSFVLLSSISIGTKIAPAKLQSINSLLASMQHMSLKLMACVHMRNDQTGQYLFELIHPAKSGGLWPWAGHEYVRHEYVDNLSGMTPYAGGDISNTDADTFLGHS